MDTASGGAGCGREHGQLMVSLQVTKVRRRHVVVVVVVVMMQAACVAFAVQIATVLCRTRASENVPSITAAGSTGGVFHLSTQESLALEAANYAWRNCPTGYLNLNLSRWGNRSLVDTERVSRTNAHGTVSYRERFTFPTKANALFCL